MNYDYIFRILLLGQEGTGRTTLIKNHMGHFFDLDYKLTLEPTFAVKSLTLEDGKIVKLQFWTLLEKISPLNNGKFWFRGASGAIILYDITNKESINNLGEWCQDIRINAGDIPILLVGNKLDRLEKPEVSSEYALMLNEQYSLSGTLEISAKTGENVEEMFIQLTELMIRYDNLDKKR